MYVNVISVDDVVIAQLKNWRKRKKREGIIKTIISIRNIWK